MEEKHTDFWRDTPARFLGYTNEVGEAFRPQVPRFVIPSYIIALSYCLGDTISKTAQVYRLEAEFNAKCCETGVETFIWQTLASVLIPGFTINRIVAGTQWAISKDVRNKLPQSVKLYGATAVALLSIPLIVHPIDNLVDRIIDEAKTQTRL